VGVVLRQAVVFLVSVMITPAAAGAAFERDLGGAASAAMAGTSAGRRPVLGDVLGSPAGFGWARSVPLSATSGCLYGIDDLGWWSVGGGRVLGWGTLGAWASELGRGRYRELHFGISCGIRRSRGGCGARLRVLSLAVEGLGSRTSVVWDLGFLERVTDRWTVGIVVTGLDSGLGGLGRESVPRGLTLGWSYEAPGDVEACLDLEQGAGRARRTRIAVEVPLGRAAFVRAGRVAEPAEVCLGFGLRRGSLGVDTAVRWHAVLGFSYRTSVLLGIPALIHGEEG